MVADVICYTVCSASALVGLGAGRGWFRIMPRTAVCNAATTCEHQHLYEYYASYDY